MTDPRTDAALLAAWGDGDTAAADVLLARHFEALYLFFRTKLPGTIDDLIQSTLLACVEARHRFRGEASFRVWLLGIARKQLLRHFRSHHRAGKVFAPAESSVFDAAPAMATSLPAKLARGQDRTLLLAGLRRLPLDLQIALELRYWEGLSLEEIAAITETKAGTVKSRLARARQTLQRHMEALAAGDTAWVTQTLNALEHWAARLRASSSSSDES